MHVVGTDGSQLFAGNLVTTWDCNDTSDRWADHPELCLDAPGGRVLQMWYCNATPAHMQFRVQLEEGDGTIRLAARPEMCLDVPDGSTGNGLPLQLWECNSSKDGNLSKKENMRFSASAEDEMEAPLSFLFFVIAAGSCTAMVVFLCWFIWQATTR